jgi:hypothetical protein
MGGQETPPQGQLRNYPVIRSRDDGPYACPCCGYVTLAERGGFEICPICFWEDDGQDDADADVVLGGPNGLLSLTQARRNFATFGACDERCRDFVRSPSPGGTEARSPERSPGVSPQPCTIAYANTASGK